MEQKRLFLAIALSIGVMLVWQSFFAPKPPEPGTKPGPGATGAPQAGTQGGAQTPTPVGNGGAGASVAKAPEVKAIAVQEVKWDTGGFAATLTNKGGRLQGLTLKTPEQYVPRLDVLKPQPKEAEDGTQKQYDADGRFMKVLTAATTFGAGKLALPEDAMYEIVSQGPQGVVFRYTDPAGAFALEKKYEPAKDQPHAFDLSVSLTNLSQGALDDKLELVFYTFQEPGEDSWSPFNPIPDAVEAVCHVAGDVERAPMDDAAEGPRFTGAVAWGGVDSRYFMQTAIPRGEAMEGCHFDLVDGIFVRSALTTQGFQLPPGQSRAWRFTTYVGPKDVDAMKSFQVNLEESVDYGIFAFLCKPFRWLLVLVHGWTGNWGVAVILLTLMLRTLTFPVNYASYKSMDGMRRIQQPMQEIRTKYEHDPVVMQQKMMELYRQEGVSPFGCLPTFLQIPIFFALYRTIYSSVELYHANFVAWYTDLSSPDPYYVLPVLVSAMMAVNQWMMPQTPGPQQQQMKIMMWVMTLMFGLFTVVMPSGLALYTFVSMGVGMLQQLYIRKASGISPTTPLMP